MDLWIIKYALVYFYWTVPNCFPIYTSTITVWKRILVAPSTHEQLEFSKCLICTFFWVFRIYSGIRGLADWQNSNFVKSFDFYLLRRVTRCPPSSFTALYSTWKMSASDSIWKYKLFDAIGACYLDISSLRDHC